MPCEHTLCLEQLPGSKSTGMLAFILFFHSYLLTIIQILVFYSCYLFIVSGALIWLSSMIFIGSAKRCHDCEKSENLWMCLVCGNIGCGRKQFDGSGGNNHGIDHFQKTGHAVSCKLGTITTEGHAGPYSPFTFSISMTIF